jgi:hypothetical protein
MLAIALHKAHAHLQMDPMATGGARGQLVQQRVQLR